MPCRGGDGRGGKGRGGERESLASFADPSLDRSISKSSPHQRGKESFLRCVLPAYDQWMPSAASAGPIQTKRGPCQPRTQRNKHPPHSRTDTPPRQTHKRQTNLLRGLRTRHPGLQGVTTLEYGHDPAGRAAVHQGKGNPLVDLVREVVVVVLHVPVETCKTEGGRRAGRCWSQVTVVISSFLSLMM